MPRKHFIELTVRIPYPRDDLAATEETLKHKAALNTEIARIVTHHNIAGAVLTSRVVSVKE